MSGRYWITGVQLGVLKLFPNAKGREDLLEKISSEQFITDCPTDEDKELFKKQLSLLRNSDKEEAK